jgi:hypothetical protein
LLKDVNWRDFMSQERMVFRNLLVKFKNSQLPLAELVSPVVAVDPDKIPAWRKAVERFEKDRAGDVLPALAATTTIPGSARPATDVEVNPEQTPAWRKAIEKLEKDRASEILPALPSPRIPGSNPAITPPPAE